MEEILQNFFGSLGGQISTIVIIVALMVLVAITDKKKMDISIMIKTAMLIAIAYVLNQLTLFRMPQGGSVTPFSMLFIVLVGYLFGPKQGVIAGVAFGLLDLLLKPYVIHPVQLFLDYPLAFGALGIGSLLRNQKHGLMKTYLLGILGRFVVSSISGIIFFMDVTNGVWAGLITAIGYNFTYIAAEGFITIIILLVPQINKLFEKFKSV
jgi:thiamine transporter